MTRIEKLKVERLKRQFRSEYRDWSGQLDAFHCGYSLAITFRPELETQAQRLDAILDQITAIDPNCPKQRFSDKSRAERPESAL